MKNSGTLLELSPQIVIMKKIFTLIFLAVFVSSCSVQYDIRNGNYNNAIARCTAKLKRGNDKEKFVILLEAAYDKAYQRDLNQITYLRKEGNPSNKLAVFHIMEDIRARYAALSSLLPLNIPSKKRQANFPTIADADFIAAKNEAAEYLFAHALNLVNSGDRFSARQGWDEFNQLNSFFPGYKTVNAEMQRALALGKSHVLFKIMNNSMIVLPPGFESELFTIPVGQLNTQWVDWRTKRDSTHPSEYAVITNLKNIVVNPGIIKQDQHTESKNVPDGFEYKLDAKGNVVKDSAGNDIKIPKFKTISAVVTTVHMIKHAVFNGTVDYWNDLTHELIASFPLTSESGFDYTYATANGDLAALNAETEKLLHNMPVPFPNDVDLLVQAATGVKPLVKNIIWAHQGLVQ